MNALTAGQGREQLTTDEITAQNEEEINPDPAESMNPAGEGKPENAGVIKNHRDDGERAKKIETRLTLAILKARVYGGFIHNAVSDSIPAAQREEIVAGKERMENSSAIVRRLAPNLSINFEIVNGALEMTDTGSSSIFFALR